MTSSLYMLRVICIGLMVLWMSFGWFTFLQAWRLVSFQSYIINEVHVSFSDNSSYVKRTLYIMAVIFIVVWHYVFLLSRPLMVLLCWIVWFLFFVACSYGVAWLSCNIDIWEIVLLDAHHVYVCMHSTLCFFLWVDLYVEWCSPLISLVKHWCYFWLRHAGICVP